MAPVLRQWTTPVLALAAAATFVAAAIGVFDVSAAVLWEALSLSLALVTLSAVAAAAVFALRLWLRRRFRD